MTRKILSATKKIYQTLNNIVSFNLNPLANLSFLEDGLASHTSLVDSVYHENLVKRLLVSYHKAKAKQANVPFAYKPGGEWDVDIKIRRANYLKALADNDILALSDLFRNFFRNSGVTGMWTYGYYQDIFDSSNFRKKWFVNCILRDLKTWQDFVDGADLNSLSVPPVGNPWGYMVEGTLVTPKSCQNNYYAARVKDLLVDVKLPVVGEIGGGFGGLAYYLLSSDQPYKYIGFELPEVLLMEQYYLMNAFPKKKFLLFGEAENQELSAGVIDCFDIILMPNFQLPRLASDSVDLFINTNSLSEMDYDTVEEYIFQIARTCKLYFFHDNSDKETLKGTGHVEIPAFKFPIPEDIFKKIYKSDSLWIGGDSRYREYLYQRLKT